MRIHLEGLPILYHVFNDNKFNEIEGHSYSVNLTPEFQHNIHKVEQRKSLIQFILSSNLLKFTVIDSSLRPHSRILETGQNTIHIEGNMFILYLDLVENARADYRSIVSRTSAAEKIVKDEGRIRDALFSVKPQFQIESKCKPKLVQEKNMNRVSFNLVPRMNCTWIIEVIDTYLFFNFSGLKSDILFKECFCESHNISIWYNGTLKHRWCLRFVPSSLFIPDNVKGVVVTLQISGLHRSTSDDMIPKSWKDYNTSLKSIPVSFDYTIGPSLTYSNCQEESKRLIHPQRQERIVTVEGPFHCRFVLIADSSDSVISLEVKILTTGYKRMSLQVSLESEMSRTKLKQKQNMYKHVTSTDTASLELRGNQKIRFYIKVNYLKSSGCGGRRDIIAGAEWKHVKCAKPVLSNIRCHKSLQSTVSWNVNIKNSFILINLLRFSFSKKFQSLCHTKMDKVDILLNISSNFSSQTFISCGYLIPHVLLFYSNVEIRVYQQNTFEAFILEFLYKRQHETGRN